MPSLCSTEWARTSLRVPSGMTFGTRNSEMPLVPGGAFPVGTIGQGRGEDGLPFLVGVMHGLVAGRDGLRGPGRSYCSGVLVVAQGVRGPATSRR